MSNVALPIALTVSRGLSYGMLQGAFAFGMCVQFMDLKKKQDNDSFPPEDAFCSSQIGTASIIR